MPPSRWSILSATRSAITGNHGRQSSLLEHTFCVAEVPRRGSHDGALTEDNLALLPDGRPHVVFTDEIRRGRARG